MTTDDAAKAASSPLDSDFWEDLYRAGNPGWDLEEPALPLVDLLEGRLPGSGLVPPVDGLRVFVPGCGLGHDALFWARRGARVIALDFAPSAVQGVKQAAAAAALSAERLTVVEGDFFAFSRQVEGLPDREKWDIVFDHTFLCALPPAKRREYGMTVAGSLKKGGLLVAIFFSHGREGGPPFTIGEPEIRSLFPASLKLLSLEKAPRTIPERAGSELVGIFRKT
jgi:SAM-dependent methyltransferase